MKKVNAPGAVYLHTNESLKCWAFRSKLVLSSEQPADVNFYFFFLFWLTFFVELYFFFLFFFIISLNGRSLEKQRIQMSEISWGRRALRCEINRLYALLNNLVRTPKKKGNAFNISSRNVKLIYKEWLLCSRWKMYLSLISSDNEQIFC